MRSSTTCHWVCFCCCCWGGEGATTCSGPGRAGADVANADVGYAAASLASSTSLLALPSFTDRPCPPSSRPHKNAPLPLPPPELDFEHEASNAERCRARLAAPACRVRGRVAVPAIDHARTAPRVVTMEFVDGGLR